MPARTRSSPASSVDEGRFPAGTVLAGRYRILGLAGKGGMGEVYRAVDTKLGQAVALKFLAQSASVNERTLERFHNEVRIARQVSHPNVSRVYDIGEAEGLVYISMEYVDGEDLGSLLRRIGRLPSDKAIQIARRLCAGLAAAHDKGVLHRDLKPGNIMIDGRGQVLIMDFGLAGIAGQVEGAEIRNGTPAYMAPEQLAGREVSVQSDLYALGLVLYEMFTGRAAFPDANRVTPPSEVSRLVKDVDPRVERAIRRCLEEDPRNRPSSALAVAVALPGGDMLAEALATGETPSPEVVAAAGDWERISMRLAVGSMALVLVGLVAAVVLGSQASLLRKMPFEKSPEELAVKARELIQQFGYTGRPADSAFGLSPDTLVLRYGQTREKPETFRAQVAGGHPSPVFFWYRQSPNEIYSPYPDGVVNNGIPHSEGFGMVSIDLDPAGRLVFLLANPPVIDESPESQQPFPWSTLFAAAGLDQSRFTPVTPKVLRERVFDARMAWTGSVAHAPDVQLRVEAASWHGKPVFFWVTGPWINLSNFFQSFKPTTSQVVFSWFWIAGSITVFGIAVLLAARNYRRGRGDGRGAFRLTVFAFLVSLLEWALNANHHASVSEYSQFTRGLGGALFCACSFGILYLALEPYIRRRLPETLISWTRLLAGGVRDPLVGAHVLVGVATGVVLLALCFAANLVIEPFGSIQYGPVSMWLIWTQDARHAAAAVANLTTLSIGWPLAALFLLFLCRLVLRKKWLAAAVGALLVAILYGLQSANVALGTLFMIVFMGTATFVLLRFGVLSLMVIVFIVSLASCPLTTDFSAWYAPGTLFAGGITLALAAYCFHTAMAGRKLLKEELLEV